MADHTWVLEHIASYMAGGLDADECAQLGEHVADCAECAQALEESRLLDRTLDDLFADARPRPGLEDRMVQQLRLAQQPPLIHSPFVRFLMGAAALLLLGLCGAAMGSLIEDGTLPFPGMARKPSRGAAQGTIASLFDGSRSMTAETRIERDERALGERGADMEGEKIKSVKELADEVATKDMTALGWRSAPGRGGEARTKSAAVPGNAAPGADKPNYQLNDRIEDVSVPGPVNPGERVGILNGPSGGMPATIAPPPGFGYVGQGGGGAEKSKEEALYKRTVDGKETDKYEYRNDVAGKPQPPSAPMPTANPTAILTVTEGNKPVDNVYFKPGEKGEGWARPEAKADPKAEPKPVVPGSQVAQAPKADAAKTAEPEVPAITQRKVIRSGEIEFEIDTFDTAVDKITKIATEERGYIATVNSEKLPNGKVRGSVVVRVAPDRLDTLILKLRALGDLKNQRIGSQDVTKQYTDMESRLRAARAMENRLIEIIKTGKGEIKDLIIAEKELGVWRTKIEESEGELRYYNNLIGMSTLTVTLTEREIRSAFGVTETEKIDMGIEVEDVEKAQKDAHLAINEAKGRITKSELKQHAAGQYQCVMIFESSPEAAGPLRDRLRQLGEVVRLDVGRLQQVEGGSGKPQDSKVKREEVQFNVSLFNVVNIAPRETVQINLACVDAESAYRTLIARVGKANGRVVTHNLERQRNDQIRGTINFEVKTAEADAILNDVKAVGEVLRMHVTENPDTQNVTKSKRGFNVQLFALAMVMARETSMIQLATADVPAGFQAVQDAITAAKGRVLNAQLNEQDRQNITGHLDFEVRRSDRAAIAKALAASGVILTSRVDRAQDNDNIIDSKVRLQVTLLNVARVAPLKSDSLGVEVTDVEKASAALTALVGSVKGRMIDSNIAHSANGKTTSKLIFDVPLAKADEMLANVKRAGTLRVQQSSRNQQVPESDLAVARFDVLLSNESPLVASDEGFGASLRTALMYSFKAIFWSLSWALTGLLFVLPWALVIYGFYRLWLRLQGVKPAAEVTSTPAA